MTLYNRGRNWLEQAGYNALEISPKGGGRFAVWTLDSFWLVVDGEDESVGKNILKTGYWESWITSWFTQWVRPGMTVLDVGANCGYYTMLSERLVGPYGNVVAYEPNPDLLDDLALTRSLNGASFKHRPVALGAETGDVILSTTLHQEGGGTIKGNQGGPAHVVRATTLDSEERNLTFLNPDIIKLDIESAEEDAWLGAQVTLNGPKHCTLVMEWTPGAYSDEFADDLGDWGDLYLIGYAGEEIRMTPAALKGIDELRMIVVRRK